MSTRLTLRDLWWSRCHGWGAVLCALDNLQHALFIVRTPNKLCDAHDWYIRR